MRVAFAVRVLALVVFALVVGVVVTVGAAVLGHAFLVLKVGEDGIPAIDDTPLMFVLVTGSYLAGALSGLAIFAYGWMRFVRRRT